MDRNPDSIREAMALAGSPAGQQLLKLLQQERGDELNQAMEKVSQGDFEDAKKLVASMLSNPQARELLKQMGGQHGSDGR